MLFFFSFTALQDNFTHLSQVSLKVERKWEIPEKKHLTTHKQNLACLTYGRSYRLEPWRDNECFRALKIRVLFILGCKCHAKDCKWIFLIFYVPNRRGGGHIVFGADPVGVGVSMTLSCLHDISCTGGWILT